MSVAIERLTEGMRTRLADAEARWAEINALMGDPEIVTDSRRLQEFGREQAALAPLVDRGHELEQVERELAENRTLLDEADLELQELAVEEIETLEGRRQRLLEELSELLQPRDPNDERNVIIEIRAGTGGDEASLFAGDLLRAYLRFAERRRWKTEMLATSDTEVGGFKEVIVQINGRAAYSRLKFESGVHRVQRVPATEASGRIHTSTATVAVLPEAEEVDVQIDDADLRIDVYRSTGHGGQSVNTTDSAVRITHIPTGLVVTCQDEKSQLKNKVRALAVLRARLYERQLHEQQSQVAEIRRSQVGTGERSEKIRTYNYRENRVTDHRIGLTIYSLDAVMDGQLDPLIDPLILAARQDGEAS
jgi:peptide chain release factor 1